MTSPPFDEKPSPGRTRVPKGNSSKARGNRSADPGSASVGKTSVSEVELAFSSYVKSPPFKRLLSQLHSQQDDAPFKSLAVVSKYPQEGKTFLTAVLAFGYSSLIGKRVLIFDANSQSTQESFFLGTVVPYATTQRTGTQTSGHPSNQGSTGTRGLVDLLTMKQVRNTLYFHLHGPMTPASSEASPMVFEGGESHPSPEFQLREVLLALRPSYDLIIVDGGSLTQHHTATGFDPIVVGSQVDGVLLVTSPLSLDDEILSDIKRELGRADISLVGTIHNPWGTSQKAGREKGGKSGRNR